MTAARPIVVKNIAKAGLKSKWTRQKLRVTKKGEEKQLKMMNTDKG